MDMTIKCRNHRGAQLGYAVCIHVLNHTAKPGALDPATTNLIGTAVCPQCITYANSLVDASKMDQRIRLVCESCLLQNGIISETELKVARTVN